jgi:hypothetical protein
LHCNLFSFQFVLDFYLFFGEFKPPCLPVARPARRRRRRTFKVESGSRRRRRRRISKTSKMVLEFITFHPSSFLSSFFPSIPYRGRREGGGGGTVCTTIPRSQDDGFDQICQLYLHSIEKTYLSFIFQYILFKPEIERSKKKIANSYLA